MNPNHKHFDFFVYRHKAQHPIIHYKAFDRLSMFKNQQTCSPFFDVSVFVKLLPSSSCCAMWWQRRVLYDSTAFTSLAGRPPHADHISYFVPLIICCVSSRTLRASSSKSMTWVDFGTFIHIRLWRPHLSLTHTHI